MNTDDNQSDYPDAILDRGLAELVGGETPPDLSERILAAAQATTEPVTLAEGTHAMSTATLKQTSRFKSWAILAASLACIGTVIGLTLPTRNAARRLSDHDTVAKIEDRSDLDRAEKRHSTTRDSDGLKMVVTPHVIIQEEEEHRLGLDDGESGPVSEKEINAELIRTAASSANTQKYKEARAAAQKSASTGTRFGIRPGLQQASEPTAGTPILSKPPYVQREFRNTGEEEAERYSFSLGFERGRGQKMEASELATRVGPMSSLGLNGLINDAYADAGLWAKADPTLQEVNAALAAKLEKRKQLSFELGNGNASAATNNPEINQRIRELSGQHSTIVGLKEKTLRLEARLKELAEDSAEARRINDQIAQHQKGISEVTRATEATRQKINEMATASATRLVTLDLEIERLRTLQKQLGTGPGNSGDQYTRIYENPFITAKGGDAVSTFSIDVDTASYANVRQFLESGQLPPSDAVRIEELVNYFPYNYEGPKDDTPFAAHMEVAACPWNPEHRLARIAIKGKEIDRKVRPQSNLVFLIDVSGSMDEPNKLPLLIDGMKLLVRELGENDKVAIVVYASSEGMALPSTRGDQQQTILTALDNLRAGGSTAGGAGINLAYQVAQENFIPGGTNRVILCTDGDFNVGVTDTAALTRLAEEKAKSTKVFLTVLGFGRGNLNDAMMEGISNHGNGNYHYVDNLTEARKVLVEEMSGTLVTIAKDVKIQVEFNPAKVAGYRLIGYENRMLRTEDFNDDKKDAGEIGAGHTVTALYEIIPPGETVGTSSVDPLKYQTPNPPPRYSGEGLGEGSSTAKPQAANDELLTLKLRYKLPDADTSTKLEFPITDRGGSFADATDDFQFAAAVASFGMLLRNSEHKGNATFDAVQEIAQSALGEDPHGYRGEFLKLVRAATNLAD